MAIISAPPLLPPLRATVSERGVKRPESVRRDDALLVGSRILFHGSIISSQAKLPKHALLILYRGFQINVTLRWPVFCSAWKASTLSSRVSILPLMEFYLSVKIIHSSVEAFLRCCHFLPGQCL